MSMIHEVTCGLGSKLKKRKGRGESSGMGKTSGRGNKGSKARTGRPYWKPGHEGGQTPIHRRLPKRGFSNDPFENPYYIVNLGDIESFDADVIIDADMLAAGKFIPDTKLPVKILAEGTLTKKLTIKAAWYSKSALVKIAEVGAVALNAKGEKFELPKPKKKFIKRIAPKVGEPKAEQAKAEPAKEEAPAAEAKTEQK